MLVPILSGIDIVHWGVALLVGAAWYAAETGRMD